AELVRRRPDSASAHFNFGYVLRYAGLLDDSARECDTALALDPRNSAWRSCAVTFTFLGKYDRAMEIARLGGEAQWETTLEDDIRLRQGQREQAILLLPRMPDRFRETIQPCLSGPTPAAADEWKAALPTIIAGRDPEPKYYQATHAAYCRQDEI